MNEEYTILEAYIKNVCKGIKDKEAKSDIRDELLSHMLEIYDTNIALGLSHDEAQKDVVRHMGEGDAISKTFKQLYFVNTIVLILKYFSKVLNYINLLALLMFIPGKYGLLLLNVENGTLTENIGVNQVVVALLVGIVVMFVGEITNVPRAEAPIDRIIESETHIKVLVPIFLILCLCSFFILNLEKHYILVCLLHAMCIFSCSRNVKLM